MRLFILTTLLLSGCAHNDAWTQADTNAQLLVTAAVLADAYTTSNIGGDTREVGPAKIVLGSQPEDWAVWTSAVAVSVVYWLAARAVSRDNRRYVQAVPGIAHGAAAIHNCSIGLCK